jgi:hypothetical protein
MAGSSVIGYQLMVISVSVLKRLVNVPRRRDDLPFIHTNIVRQAGAAAHFSTPTHYQSINQSPTEAAAHSLEHRI